MYEQDLVLNKLRGMICHKIKAIMYIYIYIYIYI